LRTIYIQGTPFLGANTTSVPAPGGFGGKLLAWNAATGKPAWSIEEPLPVYSGVLATAGNLVFYGTLEGMFKAVNATTGKVLFETKLECGIVGAPIAYTAPDGRQRIAVYSGIGWLAGGLAGGAPCPALDESGKTQARGPLAKTFAGLQSKSPPAQPQGVAAPTSGAVHVFKLP